MAASPAVQAQLATIPKMIWATLPLYQAVKFYGALPSAGGVLDQPARLTLMLQIIEDEFAVIHKERQQEQQALQQARSRMGI